MPLTASKLYSGIRQTPKVVLYLDNQSSSEVLGFLFPEQSLLAGRYASVYRTETPKEI